MICYKDMTFCPFFHDCAHAKICDRPLTQAVKDAAARWWGEDGAPIASYTEKPSCHESTSHDRDPLPDFPTGRRSVPPSHDESGNSYTYRDDV